MCHEITVWTIYILICCCYCFKINYFSVRLTLFLWGWLHRKLLLIWAKGIFLCVYFFFLCRYPHRKIIFNLDERNFPVHVRPTEKLFLTANTEQLNFSIIIFPCVFFWGYTVRKIFFWRYSHFLCVFAHTEKCEIPVVLSVQVTTKINYNENLNQSRGCSSIGRALIYAWLKA